MPKLECDFTMRRLGHKGIRTSRWDWRRVYRKASMFGHTFQGKVVIYVRQILGPRSFRGKKHGFRVVACNSELSQVERIKAN